MAMSQIDLLEHTTNIVSAFVGNNSVQPSDLPGLIANTYVALARQGNDTTGVEPEPASLSPAAIRQSITPDHLICLEDGKKFRALKRHLRVHYDLSPDEYRKKWGLPHDYPMVAPNYAATRSELAKAMGLGRRPS